MTSEGINVSSSEGTQCSAQVTDDVLDEDSSCAICYFPMVLPVQLPCSHIFCFLCIKGVALTSSPRCALCRHPIPADFLLRPTLVQLPSSTRQKQAVTAPAEVAKPLQDSKFIPSEAAVFTVEQSSDHEHDPESADPLQEGNESLLPEEEIPSENYQWYYEGRNGWWKYDQRTSEEIELIYQKKESSCQIMVAGLVFIVDFARMLQYRARDPTKRRRIKRDLCTIAVKGVAGITLKRLEGVDEDEVPIDQPRVNNSYTEEADNVNGEDSTIRVSDHTYAERGDQDISVRRRWNIGSAEVNVRPTYHPPYFISSTTPLRDHDSSADPSTIRSRYRSSIHHVHHLSAGVPCKRSGHNLGRHCLCTQCEETFARCCDLRTCSCCVPQNSGSQSDQQRVHPMLAHCSSNQHHCCHQQCYVHSTNEPSAICRLHPPAFLSQATSNSSVSPDIDVARCIENFTRLELYSEENLSPSLNASDLSVGATGGVYELSHEENPRDSINNDGAEYYNIDLDLDNCDPGSVGSVSGPHADWNDQSSGDDGENLDSVHDAPHTIPEFSTANPEINDNADEGHA